jgi:peptidyl-prolyl cis-trans isomerase D
MLNILRKHRNWLMIVIAVLALPFCIYFVKTDPSMIKSDQFARIYGRSVSTIEAQRDARLLGLAGALGMSDFVGDLAGGATQQGEKAVEFIVNLNVLRHEAAQLGIQPTRSEIVDAVRNLPAFRGPSGFDASNYDEFAGKVLSPNGFTDEQVEELARDGLCLNRIKELISIGVPIPEEETKSDYEQFYGKNFASVIRLRAADFLKEIKLTDDDVKKYYDAHKAELKTEEKRKIEFVRLSLTDEQKKLTGRERIEGLQKLADRANDFGQALLEKGADFNQVAAKFQLPIQTTGEFVASKPDPKLTADPQLNQTAFRLTTQEPNSDPIQVADGFCILHLAGIVEARPLTLDEAKPQIVDSLKNSRAREWAVGKGPKAAQTLREDLKEKEPLSFALEQAGGLKAEKVEPFKLADDVDEKNPVDKPKNEPPDMMAIKNVAAELQPGDVSDFFPTRDGGIIVLLEKRELPDPAKYQEGKAAFEERYLRTKREIAFNEWLRDRQRAADVQFAKG